MANIQLSALVTSISGSIGGTTFRRTPRGIVAYNKQPRLLTTANNINQRRFELGSVFQSWNNLPNNEKEQWQVIAQQVPFVDKFGKQYYLSNRQLYTKVKSQALIDPLVNPDPFNFVTDVDRPTLAGYEASVGLEEIGVDLNGLQQGARVAFGVKPKIRTGSVKPHAHFRVQQVQTKGLSNSFDITSIVRGLVPSLEVGQVFEVHVYVINASGMVSPTLAFDIVLAA